MQIFEKKPPRSFQVGAENKIVIKDCGSVLLDPEEQLTFLTNTGAEYDVAKKSWGFYATPSVNGRLKDQGFKTALVSNRVGQVYVMIVEASEMKKFELYCKEERQKVLEWIDERAVRMKP